MKIYSAATHIQRRVHKENREFTRTNNTCTPRQGLQKKSTSFRENRIGKYGDKDQLSFSPFLIYGFGVPHQVFGDYFYLTYCFTYFTFSVFIINLLNHTQVLHPCIFFCPPQKDNKSLLHLIKGKKKKKLLG